MADTGERWEGFSVDIIVTLNGMFQSLFDEAGFVSVQCSGDNFLVCSSFNSLIFNTYLVISWAGR